MYGEYRECGRQWTVDTGRLLYMLGCHVRTPYCLPWDEQRPSLISGCGILASHGFTPNAASLAHVWLRRGSLRVPESPLFSSVFLIRRSPGVLIRGRQVAEEACCLAPRRRAFRRTFAASFRRARRRARSLPPLRARARRGGEGHGMRARLQRGGTEPRV